MKAAVTEGVTITEKEVEGLLRVPQVGIRGTGVPYRQAHPHLAVQDALRRVDQFDRFGRRVGSGPGSEAEKVRNEIQNGSDFITQVEKYSDDDATNENGGKLGAVIRGQMVPAFEEAVFGMQKGDLSEPVKTQYGYHLIQVTDITPKKQLAYDQVKESIRTALLEQKQTETWEEWLADKQADLGVSYRDGYAPSSAAGQQQRLEQEPEPGSTTTTEE